MTIQSINLGTYPNDGTGDDLRTAFTKVNENFALLDQEINVANATNLGTGVGLFAQKSTTDLEFKSLISTDDSVTITASPSGQTVNLRSTAKVESDAAPALGGDLDVAGFKIVDSSVAKTGDIQTTIFGIDVPIVNALLELMLISNNINVDLGNFTFNTTVSYPTLDLGYFEGITYPNNNLDFGFFV